MIELSPALRILVTFDRKFGPSQCFKQIDGYVDVCLGSL